MRTYEHLGFDPVASDESAGEEVAGQLRRTVTRLEEVHAVLAGTGDQAWKGRTAEAFRDSVDEELRPRVSEALHSFAAASRAFDSWVVALPGYRRRADALEVEAAEATRAAAQASARLDGLSDPGPEAEPDAVRRHEEAILAANTAMGAAREHLADVLRRARTLRTEVEDHAAEVAGALDTAMEVAPDEPSVWAKLGGAAVDLFNEAVDAFNAAVDWLAENVAPIVQKLARIIGAVATILAIVAFVVGFVFPPAWAAAGALSTVARVAALVDLGAQGLSVLAGEEGAWQGFALSAGAMLLGFGAARAIGPIAMNAQSNIRNGLFVPQLSLAGAGSYGGPAVAVVSYSINPDFFHSLVYWGVTSYKSLKDSGETLYEESR